LLNDSDHGNKVIGLRKIKGQGMYFFQPAQTFRIAGFSEGNFGQSQGDRKGGFCSGWAIFIHGAQQFA